MDYVKPQKISGTFTKQYSLHLLIILFGVFKFCIHLFTMEAYGLHADELYYIELSRSFEWGYLDISPFVTWMGRISSIFGNAVISWRMLPCLFSAFTVILTGQITRLLGGKQLAVSIACSALICSPAVLATSYLLQPAVFDQFFWTLLTYALLAYQKNRQIKYLYLASAAFSFGMLNKYTILIYLGSLGIAYLFFKPKHILIDLKKLFYPALLSIAILLPNIIWQWHHGFPILHYSSLVAKGALYVDLGDYLFQLFFFHGASVAVWTAGLIFLFFPKENIPFQRIWPISFLMVVLILLLLKGKLYYGLGAFPLFFASGGYCWAIMLKQLNKAARVVFFIVLYAFGALSLPLVIPLLPIEVSRMYIAKMVKMTSFTRPLLWEDGTSGTLPQFFADMTGWELMAKKVERVADRYADPKLLVLTDNYAIAGGLMFYGGQNMPRVISVHNSFLLSSPPYVTGKNIIYLSKDSPSKVQDLAREVKLAEVIKMENSQLSGIHIYMLIDVNARFQNKYNSDRETFYPQAKRLNAQPLKFEL
ncbi:ArnT family glycosyltransferase [Pedobacter rhodius]|uniref:Glycosyltransferase family 39 protein n=1 Tax=Pedobacter rhodius TaxID=3004098 RepID=A0ABT4KWW4_9SPHI|nr:glycosyltransferase family 39 protein [Pedobacter sp. SJ11]MCZ4223255.1 glycosyltransferase family 39 protein [Pedobacter sp. SJ11]